MEKTTGRIEIVGMNLQKVFKALKIDKSDYKLMYKQNEGGISRIWEIWSICKDAWDTLDTLNQEEENQLIFKHDAWWWLPEPRLDINYELEYGYPEYIYKIKNKDIKAWCCEDVQFYYDSLIEYFHKELDEYCSSKIANMCVELAKVNHLSLVELFSQFQKKGGRNW